MVKKKTTKPVKKAKANLVWEFRWKNVYIEWTIIEAKEYADYLEFASEAVKLIKEVSSEEILSIKK